MLTLINYCMEPLGIIWDTGLDVLFAIVPNWGGLGTIVAIALHLLILGGILFGLAILLMRLHSREYVREVTLPFTKLFIITGVAAGLAVFIKPAGKWGFIFSVAMVCWLAFLVYRVREAVLGLDSPPRGRAFYGWKALAYGVEMFYIGLFALVCVAGAFIVAVGIILGLAVIGVGFNSMGGNFSIPHIGLGLGGGGGGGERTATLDDGTRITEHGATWYENGGSGTYKENMDGTFTKTS